MPNHHPVLLSPLLRFVTLANVHGNNHDDQKTNFGLKNWLNLAYAHLQFKKISRGNTPGSLKREREEIRRVEQGNGR
jgi:hypothetical protein